MDTLVIADAGLPIPAETMRIDLALTKGIPGAIQTLEVVLDEMKVEKVILAEETKDRDPVSLPIMPMSFSRRDTALGRCERPKEVTQLRWFGTGENPWRFEPSRLKSPGDPSLRSG